MARLNVEMARVAARLVKGLAAARGTIRGVAVLVPAVLVGPVCSSMGGGVLAWLGGLVRDDASTERRLREDEVVSRNVPADGDRVALIVAGAVATTPGGLVEAYRRPDRLWRGTQITKVQLLSMPPRLEDFDRLELGHADLDALRRCVSGDCAVKVSAAEIGRIRRAIAVAGAQWRPAAQRAFKQVLLERAASYLRDGMAGADPYADGDEARSPAGADAELLGELAPLFATAPELAAYLKGAPVPVPAGTASSLLWLETRHPPKPTIQLVHVVAAPAPAADPAAPRAIVAWRLIYASHYINGWVAVGGLLNDPTQPDRRYVAYAHRAAIDGLRGWFGGLRRPFIERRLRAAAMASFAVQRTRLERQSLGALAPAPQICNVRHSHLTVAFRLNGPNNHGQ